MTNNRTIEGRAKVCDQREHRATLRPRGRRRDVSANRDFFELANRDLANRPLANCYPPLQSQPNH